MEESKNQKYISLLEAARLCSYSEPYLRLRARQGKLKSIKLGKKWMTTRIWLDEYQKRVEDWRAAGEAKKSVIMPVAAYAAPPSELERVMPPRPIVANFCTAAGAAAPPLPNRRRAGFSAGQIFPPPRPTITNDTFKYGRFGALISGALVALLFFAAVDPKNFSGIVDFKLENAGQASVSRSIPSNFKNRPAAVENNFAPVENSAPMIENGALKELVRMIADWFK
jgi:hypothetical protein